MVSGKKTRVGLIGAGNIAKAHADALVELKNDVDFRAVCEVDEERGKQFQQKYGIPNLFKDYRELLAVKDIEVEFLF